MMKLAKPCQEHSFSPIVIHGAFKDDLESELILLTFMPGIEEKQSRGMVDRAFIHDVPLMLRCSRYCLRDYHFIN